MMQHEITTSGPLLDGSGNLREPGYAKRLLPIYRRADIKAPASRIKEWDYYLVANDHFAVALTIDDNGYMGLDSISFLHFDERWERTKSPMRAFPMGKTGLPESSARGTTAISGRGYALVFRHVPGGPGADLPHGEISGRPDHRRVHCPDGGAGGIHGHLHTL